ncbi:tetratricopeptide repeat protein [Psychrosphaera sp. B3R10]|uniref:Tetratricopeptide repeat protein n=1 Tax=Psychrosphaera algicola TaxID=3023714 RepID=A0ABT5FHT6_9GAMM|nr:MULTISPECIES: tetratricopeptide repeat protein [unclassified Psychrosphaera]MBU2880744.1 tetratricopeptide repeat protein [Psychrosphaera sp. I2R16]MBU2991510.1 tetratricopeptide repeat protein [Psychrosphaera sp. B3R10]MDC2890746.1 tetratricopeptide repeat protein [Psychrosphaera sp. G1-22]MDO6719402.1 tetratricopeptide repeat protein [Psychrosphaera sp. 1_MG-2023]
MEIYSTEEQQVEAIKKYWHDNGTQIIVGALLGLGGFFAWNQYVDSKIEAQEAASAAYDQFIEKSDSADANLSSELQQFVDAHGESGYAIFVNLVAARKSVEDNKFEQALSELSAAAKLTTDQTLSGLIATRIARVNIELKQYDAALTTLNAIKDEGYKSRVAELKGDVYLAQGNADKARVEYQAAADAGGLTGNTLLKMKLDDLALSSEVKG